MPVGVRRAATRPGDLRGVRIPSGPGNHRRHRAHQRGIEFDFGASDRIRTCDPRFIRGSGSFGRAHDLFVSPGYGRTTITEVANTAGVAVETVYGAYRNKPTLLRTVWYAPFRGDDEDIRLLDRPEILAVLAEPDLATRPRAHAAVVTPVFRRITPLCACPLSSCTFMVYRQLIGNMVLCAVRLVDPY